MGSTELVFFEDDFVAEPVHVACSATRKRRGDPRTDSIFSTLRARRAGHGARARARLATDGSPVDSASAEASGAEICLARPSRKRPADRKKHIIL